MTFEADAVSDAFHVRSLPSLPESLAEGLWLGEANRIEILAMHPKGWVAVDTTGAIYHQWMYPEGLHAAREPLDALFSHQAPRIPWPPHTLALGIHQ